MNSYYAMEVLANDRVQQRRDEADLQWLRDQARNSRDSNAIKKRTFTTAVLARLAGWRTRLNSSPVLSFEKADS